MLFHPNNQWPSVMIHPAIEAVAIEFQRMDYGKREPLSIEYYRSHVQMAWLEEMAPAGRG